MNVVVSATTIEQAPTWVTPTGIAEVMLGFEGFTITSVDITAAGELILIDPLRSTSACRGPSCLCLSNTSIPRDLYVGDTTRLAEVMLGFDGFRVLETVEINHVDEQAVTVETTATWRNA